MKSEGKYSFLEAKSKLEALCAYQERCSHELNLKMIQWKLNQEDRDRLLAHLISNNFLNEERFAEAFVSGKVNIKKWGKVKIKMHLKQKFISDYSIQKALKSIPEETYINNLNHLATKKYNTLSTESDAFKRKMKVFKFLASKGYETARFEDIQIDW